MLKTTQEIHFAIRDPPPPEIFLRMAQCSVNSLIFETIVLVYALSNHDMQH